MSLAIRLPFLRPRGRADAEKPFLRLWPGLPGQRPPTHWLPGGFPYTPAQAGAILNDLAGMDVNDLESWRGRLTGPGQAATASAQSELAAIASFASGSCGEKEEKLELAAREMAQKTLLWIWLAEMRLEEIARLARGCSSSLAALSSPILEPEEAAGGDPLDISGAPAPSWRACVASAALFLPCDALILAEGEMAADLQERLDFSPHSGTCRIARAPLWRVLGRPRPPERFSGLKSPFLAAVNCRERLWLVERN